MGIKKGGGIGESITSVKNLDANEKQKKALALRRDGATYEQIAEALGYRSPSGAHKAIMLALKANIREPAEQLRQIELQRLDKAQLAIAALVQKGDLKAIDRWIKLTATRAALLGLNAPIELKVNELVQARVGEEISVLFETIASDPDIPFEAKQKILMAAAKTQERSAAAINN